MLDHDFLQIANGKFSALNAGVRKDSVSTLVSTSREKSRDKLRLAQNHIRGL